jgi:hypothetical protein
VVPEVGVPSLLVSVKEGSVEKAFEVGPVELAADDGDLLAAVADTRVPDAVDPLERCRVIGPLVSWHGGKPVAEEFEGDGGTGL